MRTLLAWEGRSLAPVVCWVLLMAGPGVAHAGVPADFIGLTAEDVSIGDSDYRATAWREQKEAGAGIVRITFDWTQIEPEADSYDFTAYDEEVAAAAENGMRVLPVLANPPRFWERRPAGSHRRGTYPPDPGAMARFAAALVGRYGPDGTLFAERPELRRVPIRSWQIWNEPNLPVYWLPRPNPRRYVGLLRTVGSAIHAADPRAEVVSAGLPESRSGMSFARFVKGMYRAGGRGAFDTFAVHPYARTERGVVGAVRLARKLARRHGDRRRRVWVTEIGWSSSGPRSPFKAGPRGQAKRIRATLKALARRRKRLRVRGVVYYNWRDYPFNVARGRDFFGLHTGLLRADGSRKFAYYAFAHTARDLR